MIILLKLILAHLIGDFLLQPKSWVEEKRKHKALSRVLYLHVLVHIGLMLLLIWDLSLWPLAMLIGVGHLLIDIAKLYLQKEKNKTWWFVSDQLSHLVLVVGLWYWWFDFPAIITDTAFSATFWIYVTAIFFLSFPIGIIIKELLSSWSEILFEGSDESLADAGKYIGILERLLIFTFIATGHWEGVGFLLAAKSIFRFGDLKESKDRKLTEYILIGTLLSFGIAIIISLGVERMT
ncbi:MAG: DUF3307 domain-containing protein [Bacteroidales bacterium]|nr:DUF3307 domain-containing protein [Bacteroidales bacterium]